MILYLSIIFVCMTIIVSMNSIFNLGAFNNSIWLCIGVVVGAVVIEIIIDLIFAGLIHAMKDKYFDSNKKFFVVSQKERKFYEKLHIKAWKDKVIELGALGGFRKNKIRNEADIAYVNRFLIESNKGIVVHIADIFFGFLIIFIPPFKWSFCVGLPVAIVNTFLSILPIFILRYNTPKLLVLKKRIERTSDFEIEN